MRPEPGAAIPAAPAAPAAPAIPAALAVQGAALALLAAMIAVAGCASNPRSGSDLTGRPDTYGRRLLVRRCQTCHAVPEPSLHTRAQWEKNLAKMKLRLHLPQADWDTLLALVPKEGVASR